jgi:hypothetical protein
MPLFRFVSVPPHPRSVFQLYRESRLEFQAEYGIAHPDVPVVAPSPSSPWQVFSSQSDSMISSLTPASQHKEAIPLLAPRPRPEPALSPSSVPPMLPSAKPPPFTLFGGAVRVDRAATEAHKPALPPPPPQRSPVVPGPRPPPPEKSPSPSPPKRKRAAPNTTLDDYLSSPASRAAGSVSAQTRRIIATLPFARTPGELDDLLEECATANSVSLLFLGCLQSIDTVYGIAVGVRVAERLRPVYFVPVACSDEHDVGVRWLLRLLVLAGPRKICYNVQARYARMSARVSQVVHVANRYVQPAVARAWLLSSRLHR